MKIKFAIIIILFAISNCQTTQPNVVQPNINQPIPSLPFKDGDIVQFESSKLPGAFIWSKYEDCKDKKPGDQCGDVKGYVGSSNQGVRYILRKGQGNTFCLELAAQRNVYLYLKDVKDCRQGDNECGNSTNLASNECKPELQFNLIPIRDSTPTVTNRNASNANRSAEYVALQSIVNSKVYLFLKSKDCDNRVRNNDQGDCADVKGRYIDNVNFQKGQDEVFRVIRSS
jgi:hypothetical protein